jgi:hypothetical protein
MAINLFGFSIGKKDGKDAASAEEILKKPVSFVPPDYDDGATPVEVGGYFGAYVDFDGSVKSDIELIYKYREMALHPECESAIADICNESIVYNDTLDAVKIDVSAVKQSKTIKDKIEDEFHEVLNLLDFTRRGYEVFRKWYVDSRIYYHVIVDEKNKKKGILELRPIDPVKIRKVRKIKKKPMTANTSGGQTKNTPLGVNLVSEVEEFYIYSDQDQASSTMTLDGLKISPDAICFVHSGLYDSRRKKIVGYLHKAIKALNQLRMIEDAVIIYRLARAPERRIFYVDVGNLPKQKAEEYVRGLMQRYRNKLMYDPNTGEMNDTRKHLSMLEDFWMPRREGGKGTEVSTLQGGQNLGEMEDVKYFQKKLFQSLNVPTSRLEESTGFNIGRASEISRDEVKFFKFVERLRMKFSEVFLNLLRVQLVLKGIIREDEWQDIEPKIAFKFNKDSHFSELKESEVLKDRLQVARDTEDFVGKYYSRDFVRRHILKQTAEDIEEIDKAIKTEMAEGKIVAPEGQMTPAEAVGGAPAEGGAAPQGGAPVPEPEVTIGEIVGGDEDEDEFGNPKE